MNAGKPGEFVITKMERVGESKPAATAAPVPPATHKH
jgi:hypothetical protein